MRMRIRDPGIFLTLDPESGMKKIRIRDHPGSATVNKKFITSLRSFLEKKNEGSDGKHAKMKQKYPTATAVKEVYEEYRNGYGRYLQVPYSASFQPGTGTYRVPALIFLKVPIKMK